MHQTIGGSMEKSSDLSILKAKFVFLILAKIDLLKKVMLGVKICFVQLRMKKTRRILFVEKLLPALIYSMNTFVTLLV